MRILVSDHLAEEGLKILSKMGTAAVYLGHLEKGKETIMALITGS